MTVFQIIASPSPRSRQLQRRTRNFFFKFLQFYVYDLKFKAGGLTTFLIEFYTLYMNHFWKHFLSWKANKLINITHTHTPYRLFSGQQWLHYMIFANCYNHTQNSQQTLQSFPPWACYGVSILERISHVLNASHCILMDKLWIMYGLEWWTVYVLTRGLFWCSFPEFQNKGNKHQNNPILST